MYEESVQCILLLEYLRKSEYNIRYKTKKVKCINNNTIYNSCKEAEINLNLAKNTVSRVARGERKSVKGYKFVYI